MASPSQCFAPMARLSLSAAVRPSPITLSRLFVPSAAQTRHAATKKKEVKKKPKHKEFKTWDMKDLKRYSLCDAVRYLRASEVGYPPSSVKYDVAIKLGTVKTGAVIRGRIRLPHPIKSAETRIAVICKEGSEIAKAAREAGAFIVGEAEIFDAIQTGKLPFNRLICHKESEPALKAANLARILGPKKMMPNTKQGTLTPDVLKTMRDLAGAEAYREKMGVLRMGIGMINFTPQMLAENITAFADQVKKNIVKIEEDTTKEMQEVVLSTTHGPGFSLDGSFGSTDPTITPEQLSTAM